MEPRTPEQLPMVERPSVVQPEVGYGSERHDIPLHEKEVARHERGMEQSAADAHAAAMPANPILPPPATQQPSQVIADDSASQGTGLQAADDDLIEKEWVDKIKQVLAATKEDPHAREMGIAALQREYLQKRYGKVLGAVEE